MTFARLLYGRRDRIDPAQKPPAMPLRREADVTPEEMREAFPILALDVLNSVELNELKGQWIEFLEEHAILIVYEVMGKHNYKEPQIYN